MQMSLARAPEIVIIPVARCRRVFDLLAAIRIDLYGEWRQRLGRATFLEQPGHAYVRDRQPHLPLVRLLAGLVGFRAADVHELAVPHRRGGLAPRRPRAPRARPAWTAGGRAK